MRLTERGFTLVEAVVAAGLLAGAVAALAHLFAASAGIITRSHYLTGAVLLAQQKLERLRAEPALGDEPPTVEYLDAEGVVLCGGPPACGGAVFRREWSVQPSELAAAAVFVQVSVAPAAGSARPVHLVTVRPRAR